MLDFHNDPHRFPYKDYPVFWARTKDREERGVCRDKRDA